MTADDVLVAVTTLSFDIAGLELYLPLVTGGRVVIAPQAVAADPRRARRADRARRRDGRAGDADDVAHARRLRLAGRPGLKALCGGEALPQVLAEQLLERGLELWNMYGPTETTIWSTISRVRPGEPLTIGRPIANTSALHPRRRRCSRCRSASPASCTSAATASRAAISTAPS